MSCDNDITIFLGVWLEEYGFGTVSASQLLALCTTGGLDLLPTVREAPFKGFAAHPAEAAIGMFLSGIELMVFEVDGIALRARRGGKTKTRRPGWQIEAVI